MADSTENVAKLNEAQQMLTNAVESLSNHPQSITAQHQVRHAAQLMTHAVTQIMRSARDDYASGSH